MLFRVIWPGMTGRVFQARQARFWEDIIADAKEGDVIVTSPAHLQRLHPDLAEMARPGLIFCSGGPLDLAAAGQTKSAFDRLPTEIFGSTETGGMAWRRQSGPDTPWRPLPNVLVDLDDQGCLKVRAAHIGPDWYQTEDRAVFDPADTDGDFRLRGRADRVVKIEGKRVSPSAVERHLRQSGLVEDAVVLVPSANGQPDARLAAIVILNADGQAELEKLGNFRMGRVLRRHLSKFEESAALPQRWRFVEAFPVDSQGKKPHHLLSSLFDNPAPKTALHAEPSLNSLATNGHSDMPTDPIWTSHDRNGDTALIGLTVPENLLFFQGHFANHPVLPGVVQLHWAQDRTREAFGLSQIPHEVTQLKFRRTIGPGDAITLRLDFNRDKRQVKFSYGDADGDRASGILKFRETP
jgi:3-hydroxymyristoyl/3-hydroxydecanoyl-(acyl carrier protein) dehydratase